MVSGLILKAPTVIVWEDQYFTSPSVCLVCTYVLTRMLKGIRQELHRCSSGMRSERENPARKTGAEQWDLCAPSVLEVH